MRAHVLALEVVLPAGRVVRTGSRARKSSAGYDLTALLVGSEGTLGVITELALRVHGIPDHAVVARIAFGGLDDACAVAVTAAAAGLAVTRLELLDAETVRAVNAYNGTALDEAPSLFVELAGAHAAVEGDLETLSELAGDAIAFVAERDPTARSRLWQARHNVMHALVAATPGKEHFATDACVPVAQLPAALAFARAELDRAGVMATIVAHAGDGNYHVLFMLDPDDPAERERARALNRAIVDWALDQGGTCTGEHGIGLGKVGYLEREHGDLLDLMRGVKALFDPNGIMNPGKLLPQ
jgi:D-lactate dehydrogenase (cytochrome)